MTEPLTTPRVLPSPIGPVIPAVDVARNIGYSRSALTHAMSKNKPLFNGLKISMEIETARGAQQGTCLNSEGVAQLLSVLSPSGTSKSELKERLDAYREKVFGGKAMLPAAGPDSLTVSLQKQADIADILITKWGRDPEAVRRLCMAAVIEECGDAIRYRGLFTCEDKTPLLPSPEGTRCADCIMAEADPDFEKYFSRQKVADMTGTTYDQVGNILEGQGILTYANGTYHLTKFGETSGTGKVFTHYPLAPHRMTPKKMIRFSNIAVERVRAHLSAGQSKLASSFG